MSVTIPPPVEAAPPPEPPHHHHHHGASPWREKLTRRNVAIGLAVLWLLAGLYVVPPEEQAVETVFGAVTDPRVLPGVHYNPPWPVGSSRWA